MTGSGVPEPAGLPGRPGERVARDGPPPLSSPQDMASEHGTSEATGAQQRGKSGVHGIGFFYALTPAILLSLLLWLVIVVIYRLQ